MGQEKGRRRHRWQPRGAGAFRCSACGIVYTYCDSLFRLSGVVIGRRQWGKASVPRCDGGESDV
jgi:hypothetical protein